MRAFQDLLGAATALTAEGHGTVLPQGYAAAGCTPGLQDLVPLQRAARHSPLGLARLAQALGTVPDPPPRGQGVRQTPPTRKALRLALVWLVAGVLAACATTGPRVTREQVKETTTLLKTKAQVFEFQQAQRLVEIGLELLARLPDPMEVKFRVADCDEVNAGAQPGLIAICRGMLRFVASDDELGAVVGHELAHLTRGHHGKVGLLDLSAFVMGLLAESAAPGSFPMIASLTRGSLTVFDRKQESEADYYGLLIMDLAGYDPAAGVTLWERFAIELPSGPNTLLFRTHPFSQERMLRAQKVSEEIRAGQLHPEEVLAMRPEATPREEPLLYGLHARLVPARMADPPGETGQWQLWGILRAGREPLDTATLTVRFLDDGLVVAEQTVMLSPQLAPHAAAPFTTKVVGGPEEATTIRAELALDE